MPPPVLGAAVADDRATAARAGRWRRRSIGDRKPRANARKPSSSVGGTSPFVPATVSIQRSPSMREQHGHARCGRAPGLQEHRLPAAEVVAGRAGRCGWRRPGRRRSTILSGPLVARRASSQSGACERRPLASTTRSATRLSVGSPGAAPAGRTSTPQTRARRHRQARPTTTPVRSPDRTSRAQDQLAGDPTRSGRGWPTAACVRSWRRAHPAGRRQPQMSRGATTGHRAVATSSSPKPGSSRSSAARPPGCSAWRWRPCGDAARGGPAGRQRVALDERHTVDVPAEGLGGGEAAHAGADDDGMGGRWG